MDAKTAARVSQKVQDAEEKKRRAKAVRDEKAMRKRISANAKSHIKSVAAEIPKAARLGKTTVVRRNSYDYEMWSVYCDVASYFNKNGFKADVSQDRYDMGDSEYPCPQHDVVLMVSWGK